ncbi:hypothetical protein [Actinoplanes sp. DH11]|uniref:hypothetical protein n=1 Tax=Actinoplanes sp. DH11 TaxID=2857011 RepID=UPI001E5369F7|nr:hypothetical protein [Actinoplanes sp. DH11]
MLSSGPSPLTAARGGMWGFLMFAAAAWLAISWTVMRLEPPDIAAVAGAMILFGAVCELLRALAGTRTWWLNAGLTVIFAVTGTVLLTTSDSTFTTPASLVGWYLMVRGAVDVAVGIMTRGADRVWSLIVTIGVLETGLGYFSAGPFARTADLIVVTLGALALLRAVADLVTSLRLREIAATTRTKEALSLPPERAAGLTGYSAGRADYEAGPPRARHRAEDTADGRAHDATASGGQAAGLGGRTQHGTASGGQAAGLGGRAQHGADGGERAHQVNAIGAAPAAPGVTYHEHVVRTTADLDTMLAHAGITGPRAGAVRPAPGNLPAVPDTPEGVAAAETAPAGRSGRSGDGDTPRKI